MDLVEIGVAGVVIIGGVETVKDALKNGKLKHDLTPSQTRVVAIVLGAGIGFLHLFGVDGWQAGVTAGVLALGGHTLVAAGKPKTEEPTLLP